MIAFASHFFSFLTDPSGVLSEPLGYEEIAHVCSTLKLGVSGVEIDYEHIRFAGPRPFGNFCFSSRGGNFLMSGIRVCATDQGRFFTSKNPEQVPNFEVLLQNRPYFLKFYSRTGPFFTIWSQTPGSNVKIPVAFSFCFLQPDVFTSVLLYLSKCFKLSITGISLS